MRAFSALILLACVGMLTPPSARADERLVREYLEVAVRGGAARMADFYHPDEIVNLRTRVLQVLDAEAASGSKAILQRTFGLVAELEDIKRLTPVNLYLKLAEKVGLPQRRVEKIEVIGSVEEKKGQLMHVLARLIPPASETGRPRLAVVTLLRYGKNWRVALPAQFQDEVDKLLAPEETAQAAAAASGAPNTLGIERLLKAGIEALSNGDCAAYFNEHMSPNFRARTSKAALERLIEHCNRSVDTRETYIAALQVALQSSPVYEQNGTRAVYNMAGKGLPFQRFVLEKVDQRWYVAE